jgi:hypothetical protein
MTADIGLAGRKLGYTSHVPLAEGLTRMIARDPRLQRVRAE